jgi:hypothetical protein
MIAILIVVVLGFLLYGGWRVHRPMIAFVIAAGTVSALWASAEAAIRTDYRDADGCYDCWPDCTLLQSGVAVVDTLAPVALMGLIVATGGLIWLARNREASVPES